MTNKNYTHLGVVTDRSGSMANIATDMIGGLNQLFKDQAALPGKCLVDYVMFDDRYEVAFSDVPASEAKAVLSPRGSTALLDAIGKTIVTLGEKFAAMDEADRPGLVQLVIVTDGYENASREWTKAKVAALIKQQRDDYAWDVVFLGANMDAVSEGAGMGFAGGQTMTYHASAGGTQAALASTSAYITRTRTAGTAKGNSFTDDDRKNATSK